jgi:hypothetical protein
VHTWQQFHYALKQYFSIPTLHYAYLSVLEDWGRTIAELIAQNAFSESGASTTFCLLSTHMCRAWS